ncbi:hypothetical protein FHS85_004133 [Rhodoligotrophos appendicifer]|uniref:hypothetical protein n=1 Tax=Rhodoligotrophos appendicifer TaxID=987056 RepID=UPI0011857ABF|nr:hypothetical protein [Rhodoligotrophos appendicifer]
MTGALVRVLDNLLGRGDAAVTVPPLDGPLRPNRRLDEAARLPLADVDDLAFLSGQLVASTAKALYSLEGSHWQLRSEYSDLVTAMATIDGEGVCLALANGEIAIEGGRYHGRRYRVAENVRCMTALIATGSHLFVANGSSTHDAADWQRDLMRKTAAGSLWRIDLDDGAVSQLAGNLAWPAGLAVEGDGLVYAEAWRHRLMRLSPGGTARPAIVYADLPGYPGRISSAQGHHWLSVFAPRSQLVEFVLREPAYRERMIAEVPPDFWIAPKLRSGRSYYEPLQGGGVKHLGILKPWAPTMSAGLCVKLGSTFQPIMSLQSRADGATHGVTSALEHEGRLYVAARGDGVVALVDLNALGGEE